MGREKNQMIRATIDHALANEQNCASLVLYVETRLDSLHHSIQLPKENDSDTLVAFMYRYIEHVPDFLDALIDVATTAGVMPLISKLIDVAQSYFKTPPELIDDHSGLLALVDEAYLAHRLMEEVNDRIMMLCGIPLIPMDMTLSNLIVHSLLGEEFANKLDMAVYYSMETLFEDFAEIENPDFKAYIALHKAEGWQDLLNTWPCLAGDSSIVLSLDGRPAPNDIH